MIGIPCLQEIHVRVDLLFGQVDNAGQDVIHITIARWCCAVGIHNGELELFRKEDNEIRIIHGRSPLGV